MKQINEIRSIIFKVTNGKLLILKATLIVLSLFIGLGFLFNIFIYLGTFFYDMPSLMLTTPLIFKKKKTHIVSKPLQYINNDTGKTRHYPPGAQEWLNSIYTYNKNLIKTLPVIDKNLMSLLKSYFNMAVGHKRLKVKHKVNRFRRLSPQKVFVGKGDFKHTNSKVIITINIFNTDKWYLTRELEKQFKYLYLPIDPLLLGLYKDPKDKKGRVLLSHSRVYTLKEFMETPRDLTVIPVPYPFNVTKQIFTYREVYLLTMQSLVLKVTKRLAVFNRYYDDLTTLVVNNFLSQKDKLLIFSYNLIKNIPKLAYLGGLDKFAKYDDNKELAKWAYLKKLRRLLYLIRFNIEKSEPRFLIKLAYMVQKMYNKQVEFNVVDLKKLHLNSDIFTQAIALKLKNRKNRLYWVLRSSLTNVDLPNVSRQHEKVYNFDRNELLNNRIRNTYINSMFENTSCVSYQPKVNSVSLDMGDSLEKLLLKFYPSSENLEHEFDLYKSQKITLPVSLETYLLITLKHLKLAGVRVEAKGRLTKRFTASRSVFKMRYKGGLKNVDSSFKGLSAVMLRGIFNSNVQYSLLQSKNRIGAYGVKGWVGSK